MGSPGLFCFSHIRLSEKDVPTPIAWRLWTYDSGRRFISPGRPAASSCTSLSKLSPSPRFPPCHLLISLLQSTHPKQEKRLHRRCFSGLKSVKAIPHNAARADSEKNCVLMMAVFRRNTLCISRKNDEIRARFVRKMPRAYRAVLP